MRGHVIQRVLVVGVAIAAVGACRGKSKPDPAAQIERSEQRAAARDDERPCEQPNTVFDGSIEVASDDYLHTVARGEDFVDEPIDGLDEILTSSTPVRFTLDYPFERPFDGVVTGQITLRRTIDAIRAGFRQMYVGTTQRDIPGLHNKDVTGPYGQAFHVIEDLVIESIELCADDTLVIGIGS